MLFFLLISRAPRGFIDNPLKTIFEKITGETHLISRVWNSWRVLIYITLQHQIPSEQETKKLWKPIRSSTASSQKWSIITLSQNQFNIIIRDDSISLIRTSIYIPWNLLSEILQIKESKKLTCEDLNVEQTLPLNVEQTLPLYLVACYLEEQALGEFREQHPTLNHTPHPYEQTSSEAPSQTRSHQKVLHFQ